MPFVYKNPHQDSYEAVQRELQELEIEGVSIAERLDWIRRRKQQLQEYLKAVTPLIEEDPGKNMGEARLTEICRLVLDKNNTWMTAPEARHHLAKMGIGLEDYTNPMAVLHSILKRVGDSRRNAQGQVEYGPRSVIPPMPRTVEPPSVAGPAPTAGPPALGHVRGPEDYRTGFEKKK